MRKRSRIRISIIGPGSVDFYFSKVLRISRKQFNRHLSQLGQCLTLYNVGLVTLPGIGTELAKVYKTFGGSEVLAPVPLEDKKFGIEHLKEFLNEKILNAPLFDGWINTGEWYQSDFIRILLGDICLMLGYAPGAILELMGGLYIYKIISKKKEKLKDIAREDIATEIRAGTKFPFEVWIYKPFVSGKLPREIEEYCKRIGVKLVYIKDPDDLRKNLERIEKLINKKQFSI